MPSEFAPGWSKPRMTQAQVRKYLKEMEEKRKIAREKLEEYENSWELEKDQKEIEKLEEEIENL